MHVMVKYAQCPICKKEPHMHVVQGKEDPLMLQRVNDCPEWKSQYKMASKRYEFMSMFPASCCRCLGFMRVEGCGTMQV